MLTLPAVSVIVITIAETVNVVHRLHAMHVDVDE